MRWGVWLVATMALAAVLAGCGTDESSAFVGSWVETQPSGRTFLWVIDEADEDVTAWVYTDRAEWCGDQPYWSEMDATLVDDVTMAFTGVTNQCHGEEPFSNDFHSGRLLYDPATDTMRDAADPADWHYERTTSVAPADLYPGAPG